jgi:diguanylate cyclase (GGDEF)-like protein
LTTITPFDGLSARAAQVDETLRAGRIAAVAPLVLALLLAANGLGAGSLVSVCMAIASLSVVLIAGSLLTRGRAVPPLLGLAVAVVSACLMGGAWGVIAFVACDPAGGDHRTLVVATVAIAAANIALMGPLALVSLGFLVPLVVGAAAGFTRPGDGLGLGLSALLLLTFLAMIGGLDRRQQRSTRAIADRLRLVERDETIATLLACEDTASDEWVWESDARHRLRGISADVAAAASVPAASLEGRLLSTVLKGRDGAPASETSRAVLAAISNRDPFRNKIVEIKTAGPSIWWRLTGRPIVDASGAFAGYRGIGADITASRDSEARIAYLANYDCWTGLANRVLFQSHAARECQAAADTGRGGALLYLDLDGFKSVNDSLGHAAGDAVLKDVARRLTALVPRDTMIARLGGDEFAIWCTTAVPARAEALAADLIEALSMPYDRDGATIEIGASIGIALTPKHGTDPDNLLVRADLALYRAKADGKGLARLFVQDYEISLIERRKLEADLKLALARGEFQLHYQPLVDLHDGHVSCFEALIRWSSPSRGSVSPADFIPAAEASGLIAAIGRWVLSSACVAAAAWPSDTTVAVNISPRHFRAGTFVQDVRVALQTSGLKPNRLEIEVTESVFFDASTAAVDNLRALRQLGVRVALDDFGTGYSSLSYLINFPVDKIKIDRSFVRDFVERETNRAVVDAILTLARKLSIRVTAEGVETREQALALKLRRCDEIQGFLLSRPRPAEDVRIMLESVPTLFHRLLPEHLETPLGFALAVRQQAG